MIKIVAEELIVAAKFMSDVTAVLLMISPAVATCLLLVGVTETGYASPDLIVFSLSCTACLAGCLWAVVFVFVFALFVPICCAARFFLDLLDNPN